MQTNSPLKGGNLTNYALGSPMAATSSSPQTANLIPVVHSWQQPQTTLQQPAQQQQAQQRQQAQQQQQASSQRMGATAEAVLAKLAGGQLSDAGLDELLEAEQVRGCCTSVHMG